MNTERADAFTTGLFQGVKIVGGYMKERASPVLQGLMNMPEREECLYGLFLRADAWMQTLRMLDRAVHVQAIVAGNRSLLETAVDMILVHIDPTPASTERMRWWEESAKLKAAEAILTYFDQRHLHPPDVYQAQASFVANRKNEIEMQRQSLWPGRQDPRKHPDRWTGSRNLLQDVRVADQHYEHVIKQDLGTGLEEYYETEYRKMNFMVHGSTLAGFRNLKAETITYVCAISFKVCTELAMFCTKLALEDFGFADHVPALREEWERIRKDRLIAYAKYQPDLAEVAGQ
jgi:hypothetical protein